MMLTAVGLPCTDCRHISAPKLLNGVEPKNVFIGLGLLVVGIIAAAKLAHRERGHLSGRRR